MAFRKGPKNNLSCHFGDFDQCHAVDTQLDLLVRPSENSDLNTVAVVALLDGVL